MARTSLGQLTIDMVMRTAGFEQGMTRAERITQQKSRAMQRQITRVTTSITLMATTAQVFATRMFNSATTAVEATAKMATQIGTTTETLTAMRYAVQQVSNMTDQNFDLSMRRMTRRIAEAAQGSGAAAGALRALGLDARELSRMSLDEQFLALADAMSQVGDVGQELRYTMAIFDTEGMPLVNSLREGSAAAQELMERAERLGYVLNQSDARLIEDLNTVRSNLTTAFDYLIQKAVIGVAPALQEMATNAINTIESIENLGDKAVTIFTTLNNLIQVSAAILVSRYVGAVLSAAAAFTAKAAANAISNYQMLAGMGIAGRYSVALIALRGVVVSTSVAMAALGGPLGVLALAATAGYMAWRTSTQESDRYKESLQALEGTIDEVRERIRGMTQDQQRGLVVTLLSSIEEQRGKIEQEISALEGALANALSGGVAGAGDAIDDLVADLNRAIETGESVTAVLQEAANAGIIPNSVISSVANYAANLDTARQESVRLVTQLGNTQTALDEVNNAARGAAGGVSTLTSEMLEARAEGEKYAALLSDRLVTAGISTELGRLNALVDAGKLQYETEEALNNARRDAAEIDRRLAAASKSRATATNNEATALQNLLDKLLPLEKITKDYNADLQRLEGAHSRGTITADQYAEAYERLNQQRDDAVRNLIPEEIKRMQELERTASSSMETYIIQQERALAALGSSESARELASALGAVEDRYRGIAEQMAASPRGISGQDLEQLQEHMEAEMEIVEHYHNRRMELDQSWLEGAQRGLQEYIDSVGMAADISQSLMTNALGHIENALTDMLLTGELKFGDLARAIGQDLVRALVQMGVQMAANFAMSKLFTSATAATSALTGTAIAAAYAPAAAMASLASFGANAGPAMAGISSTVAMAELAAFAGFFDDGGNIPSGKWGIAGEFGPEIIQGPANVTSREDTMRMLNSNQGNGDVIVQFYGDTNQVANVEQDSDEFGRRVIRVLLNDQQSGGEFAQSTERTYGLQRMGR